VIFIVKDDGIIFFIHLCALRRLYGRTFLATVICILKSLGGKQAEKYCNVRNKCFSLTP